MATTNSGWSTDQVRRTFLDYFASRDHRIIPSASLIPTSPSTLLTGAGMQPLVPMFRGEEEPPAPRLAGSQKCVRTGDIENVGHTARHHTFFEMLGNFAFGDYFKREAIEFCWELVTQGYGLPPDALWATVYEEDDESWELWHRHIGLPAGRVIRCSKKDNWWPQTVWNGPCGPCTEVYVDQGPGIYPCDSPDCGPECDCDRYLEIWNLVFQMYNQTEDGTLSPLPTPGVDTGLGLERLAAVKQGVPTNFDIDIFRPMIAAIEAEAAAAGRPFHYGDGARSDQAVRVVVDHLRAIAFMMADTIMPSNKGRGYVLRRIVRRALRFARNLGLDDPFMFRLLPTLTQTMGHVYPELTQRSSTIVGSIRQEEERFCATLEQGIGILSGLVADAKAAGRSDLPGEEVFRLYDTFGFPVEMTEEMAAEEGLAIERQGFEAALERQRSRSVFRFTESAAAKEFYVALSRAHPAVEYVRDQGVLTGIRVLAVLGDREELAEAEEGERCALLLERTPFYPEKGGQVGDRGLLRGPNGTFRVEDTQEPVDGVIIHSGIVDSGAIARDDLVTAEPNLPRLDAVRRAHSATHLLHQALRAVLGPDVAQAGSLVEPDRLRFDFACPTAPTAEDLLRVERIANEQVLADLPVAVAETDRESAESMGAVALFGEKYGAVVRVVSMGEFSRELCGGCHVPNTARIGQLRVLNSGSIGAGVRRIEALTGLEALGHAASLEALVRDVALRVNCRGEELPSRVATLQEQVKELRRQLADAQRRQPAAVDAKALLARASEVAPGVRLVAHAGADLGPDALRDLVDRLTEADGVIALLASPQSPDRVAVVCKISKDLAGKAHAGELVSVAAKAMGGGGGGSPQFAQGAGRDAGLVDEGLAAAQEAAKAQLHRL